MEGNDNKKATVQLLALQRERDAIKTYTEQKLQDPDLRSHDKKKLVHLNQHQRLTILKAVQKHTLEHVFKAHEDFYTNRYHYDWWAFPMHVPPEWGWQQWNYDASLTFAEAQLLARDNSFTETYLDCVGRYLQAIEKNGCNYPVRYARALHSLALFCQAAKTIEGADDFLNGVMVYAEFALKYASKLIEKNPNYTLLESGYIFLDSEVEQVKLAKKSSGSSSTNPNPEDHQSAGLRH